MADQNLIAQLLMQQQQQNIAQNPYIQAGQQMAQVPQMQQQFIGPRTRNYSGPVASRVKPWQRLLVGLGQGVASGAMQGYGRSQAREQNQQYAQTAQQILASQDPVAAAQEAGPQFSQMGLLLASQQYDKEQAMEQKLQEFTDPRMQAAKRQQAEFDAETQLGIAQEQFPEKRRQAGLLNDDAARTRAKYAKSGAAAGGKAAAKEASEDAFGLGMINELESRYNNMRYERDDTGAFKRNNKGELISKRSDLMRGAYAKAGQTVEAFANPESDYSVFQTGVAQHFVKILQGSRPSDFDFKQVLKMFPGAGLPEESTRERFGFLRRLMEIKQEATASPTGRPSKIEDYNTIYNFTAKMYPPKVNESKRDHMLRVNEMIRTRLPEFGQ